MRRAALRATLPAAMLAAWAAAPAAAERGQWTEGLSASARGVFHNDARQAEGLAGFKFATDPPSIRMSGRQGGWGGLREFSLGQVAVLAMEKPKVLARTWAGEAVAYSAHLTVHLTQLAPAVLVDAAASEIAFFQSAHGETAQVPAAVRFVGFATGAGVRVASGQPFDPSAMTEPWLLCWFGAQPRTRRGRVPLAHVRIPLRIECPYPHREFAATRDRYLRPQAVDAPMLLVLEHKPTAARLSPDGLKLRFSGPAGRIVLMPLFGARWLPAERTEKWSASLPEALARRCRRFSRILRAFPVKVRQEYAIDAEGRAVSIRDTFSYVEIADDWKTPPERIAPVSPMMALAMRGGGPARLAGRAKLLDLDLPTRMGPWAGVAGGQATIRLEGILKDTFEKPSAAPADAPKELTELLLSEIDRMAAAGPLRPLRLKMGIGSAELYGNPAETAWILGDIAEAVPAARSKLRSCLDKLRSTHDLATSGWVREGSPREYFAGAVAGHGAVVYARAGLFNAYGAWKAIDVFARGGERRTRAARAVQGVTRVMGEELRRLDWAMGCAGATAGSEQLNRLAAGAIGLARLGRLAADAKAESLGTYLAAWLLAMRVAYGRYSPYHFERLSPMPEGLDLYAYWAHNGAKFEPFAVAFARHGGDYRTAYQVGLSDEFGLRLSTLSRRYHDQPAPAFLHLAPAVGRALGRHLRKETANYVRCVEAGFPGWYLTKGSNLNARSEDTYITPELPWSILQARLWALGQKGRDLRRYLDIPCCVGDLYFLHNVACVLRAHGDVRWVPAR